MALRITTIINKITLRKKKKLSYEIVHKIAKIGKMKLGLFGTNELMLNAFICIKHVSKPFIISYPPISTTRYCMCYRDLKRKVDP